MLTLAAKIVGWIFLIVGILGFIPGAAPDGHLLGLFHVNTAHNVVHVLSGTVALWAGYTSFHASKLYFLWFGLIYGLVAILGFMAGDRPVLGFLANNIADAWLHLVLAVALIALGLTPETARLNTRTTAGMP